MKIVFAALTLGGLFLAGLFASQGQLIAAGFLLLVVLITGAAVLLHD